MLHRISHDQYTYVFHLTPPENDHYIFQNHAYIQLLELRHDKQILFHTFQLILLLFHNVLYLISVSHQFFSILHNIPLHLHHFSSNRSIVFIVLSFSSCTFIIKYIFFLFNLALYLNIKRNGHHTFNFKNTVTVLLGFVIQFFIPFFCNLILPAHKCFHLFRKLVICMLYIE